MIRKVIILGVFCLIILSTESISVFGQAKEIELRDKRITIKMEKQPLGLVFRYLMENYEIPIGFEESMLDRNHSEYDFLTNLPAITTYKMQNASGSVKITTTSEKVFKTELHPITVNFENEKLESVFDQIIRQMKNYKWEINDDVINIVPINGRDERFEKLLELRIRSFNLEKGKTVEDITTKIQESREFLRFMHKNKIIFIGIRTGDTSAIKAQYGRVIDKEMDFSNLTFREILNKATKTKKGGWILKWKWKSTKTGKEEIEIDI